MRTNLDIYVWIAYNKVLRNLNLTSKGNKYWQMSAQYPGDTHHALFDTVTDDVFLMS